MPITLCAVRSSVPKSTAVPFAVSIPVRRRRSWNTWIVTCGLVIVIAASFFLSSTSVGCTRLCLDDDRAFSDDQRL
jgi:hypothetical protein